MKKIAIILIISLLTSCANERYKDSVVTANSVILADAVYPKNLYRMIPYPPVYPEEAVKRNVTGVVILNFSVNQYGYPWSISFEKSLGNILDAASISTLQRNRFDSHNQFDDQLKVYQVKYIYKKRHFNRARIKIEYQW